MRVVWNDQESVRGPGVIWGGDETGWNDDFQLSRPHITHMGETHGEQPWCVWVPYLRPEHFDAPFPSDFAEWEDIVKNASILGPYGDTFWDTHAEAMKFLDSVLRDEPKACPHCGGTTPAKHDLGPEFLVCGGCSEILYPYELKEASADANAR